MKDTVFLKCDDCNQYMRVNSLEVAKDKLEGGFSCYICGANVIHQKQDEQGTIKADEFIKKYFLQKNSDMIAIFDLLEEIVKVANINSINTVFEPDDTFDLPIRKNSKDNDLYDLANEIKRRLESIKFNKNNQ